MLTFKYKRQTNTCLIKFIFISCVLCWCLFIIKNLQWILAYDEGINNNYDAKSKRIIVSHGKYSFLKFGSYAAIPWFYSKKGILSLTNNLITVTTICDINLLYEARNIAINYKSGPISIAIYIDEDYRSFTNLKLNEYYRLFDKYFYDLSNLYDIMIGILFIDESSIFYQRRFMDIHHKDTNLMYKIPTNSLRNLAEYQVNTDWTFNVDIDFWYFSDTFNDENTMKHLLFYMNNITKYGKTRHSIFIVPSFELTKKHGNNQSDENDHKLLNGLSSLNKLQLIDKIQHKFEIQPFHNKSQAQRCTDYNQWYTQNAHYRVDYGHCYWSYEPWYIINTHTSRNVKYQWNNNYIGRGLNKVERSYKLRHYCFNFIVLHNMFIIHGENHITNHRQIMNDTVYKKWIVYNHHMFLDEKLMYNQDANSCSRKKKKRKKE